MPIKMATPYSHLFADERVKRQVLEASDFAEVRGPDQSVDEPSALWHCDLSLVRPWADRHVNYLSSIIDGFVSAKVDLLVASFHLPSRYVTNEVVDGRFIGVGDPMDDETMLRNAQTNVGTLRGLLGKSQRSETLLLVENNNHLGSDAYDVVSDPAFIDRLLSELNIELLLDLSHAKITAHNTRVQLNDYLEKLPLTKVRQVHLSRCGYNESVAYDAHEALQEEDWSLFRDIKPLLPNLEFATIEYYKDTEVLLGLLARLRHELV